MVSDFASRPLTVDIKEQLANVVKEYNGLLFSMEGVQPEKGNETLYVVREGFSGRILAAKNLKSGSKTELMVLLKPVKDLGFPFIGLVSDGQQSIRLAMGETWPETPYQYCQYHYLKDIAKTVVDLDRKLKTGLKKSLRGLREIEKQVEDDDSIESEVTRDYLAATRSLLLEDGNPPLDLSGIQIYEKAEAVKASLEKSVAKKEEAILLEKVLLLFHKLPEFTSKYHAVKWWQVLIQETARLLAPAAVTEDQRSETVRFSMQCLLSWMQKMYTRKEDVVLVSNFQSYTRGFWNGLNTCYDSPWVPHTNNDHERFFRQTKTKHRRTTGRRSWNEHILRCGKFVVLVDGLSDWTKLRNADASVEIHWLILYTLKTNLLVNWSTVVFLLVLHKLQHCFS